MSDRAARFDGIGASLHEGRQISTVRTHVRAVYDNPGLTRQHELVRLVRSLAGVQDIRR